MASSSTDDLRGFHRPRGKRRIREQAEYIATIQGTPEAAARWIARIYDKIDGLAEMPRRYSVTVEIGWCEYEVRSISIGECPARRTSRPASPR